MADSLLKSLLTTRIGDVTLLGALLFPGPSLDKAWSDRYAELSRASSRLSQIGAPEALILLRGFFQCPELKKRCFICYAARPRSLIQLCRILTGY